MMNPHPDHSIACRFGLWASALLLVLGLTAWGVAARTDSQMRQSLLDRATLLAMSLDPLEVRQLTGTVSDLGTPTYERLKDFFVRVGDDHPDVRFMYIMKRAPGDQILIMVDSESPESEDYSPPGDLFYEVDPVIHELIQSGKARVIGPVTDRWGTWISAYIPIRDPALSDREIVFGLDVDALYWRGELWRSTLLLIGALGIALLSILSWFCWFQNRVRSRQFAEYKWQHSGIPLAILLVGIILSLYIAQIFRQNERSDQQQLFKNLVQQEILQLQRDVQTLRWIQLPRFAQFFEAVDLVSQTAFDHFMKGSTPETDPYSWGWVRELSRDELAVLQQDKQAEFELWELSDEGMRRPAGDRTLYYPLFFTAPIGRHLNSEGFDYGSDPFRRQAIETARLTGLPSSTKPIPFVGTRDSLSGMIVVYPVQSTTDPVRRGGYAVIAVPSARLFRNFGQDAAIHAHVSLLQADHSLYPVYRTTDSIETLPGLTATSYLSFFGNTFRIALYPNQPHLAGQGMTAGMRAFLMGLLLTGGVALLVHMSLRQHRVLEGMVQERTSKLDAIQSRFELLTSRSGTYVWEIDMAGRFTYVSSGITNVLGYTPDEMVGRVHIADIVPPEDKDALLAHVEKTIEQQADLMNYENRMRTKDGRDIWVTTSGMFIRDPDGNPVGFRGMDTDITSRKQAESERERMLAEAEEARRILLGVIEDQHMAEENVRGMDRLLQAAAKGTQMLLEAPDLEQAVPDVLELIGSASGQDRIYIFEAHTDPDTNRPLLSQRYEWVASGISEQIDNSILQNMDVEREFPHWHSTWLEGNPILGNRDDFVDPEQSQMIAQEIVSIMIMPIIVNKRFWGMIGMDNCRETHDWSESEQAIVTSVAAAIGVAIARRRTDADLERSQSRNQALLKAMPDMYFLFDRDGRILDYSAPVGAEFYIPPSQFLNRRVRDVLPPDLAELTTHKIADVAASGQATEYTYSMELPSGRIEYFESRLVPCGDDFLALVRNITELRYRAAELQRLYTAIEQSPHSVMITNASGEIEYVNHTFEVTSGYSSDEVIGQNPRILKSGQQDESFYHDMWTAISAGNVWTGHLINRRKNGETFTEEVSVAPVRDAAGEVTHYVAIKRDITEEMARDEMLRQSQKMDSIGRLAGGIAHDFNNLLGVILGNCELALEAVGANSPIGEDLEEIRKAARRSADLTRQLLGFARRQTVNPVVIELNETVDGMLKMLRRLIDEAIHLEWEPQPTPCPVKMDPSQLDQVLVNLCVNARDAIEDTGRIVIRTRQERLTRQDCNQFSGALPGRYVVLSVEDTGCGMNAETLAHAFEPFYTTKSVGQGTGLGLATVYGIISQNHGFIHISSTLGVGTRVDIYLPRHNTAGGRPVDGQQEPSRNVQQGHETLLLVEDEVGILNITARMLEKQGYTVLAANSPEQGIELAKAHADKLDLLITDVIMPNMNGRDMYDLIQADCPTLKCLYISGYSAEVLARNRVVKDGLNFLQKPFTLASLTQHVRKILDADPARTPDSDS